MEKIFRAVVIFQICQIFIESIKQLEKNNPEARISVRKSGTQEKIRVMVEAETEKEKDSILSEIEGLIT